MIKKSLIAFYIFLLVLTLVFFIRTEKSPLEISEDLILNKSDSNMNNLISLQELEKHSTLENCWISYNGKVYDITGYLPRHPGSAGKILPYCGSATEFQQAFTKKHGTSKVNLLMSVGVFIGDFEIKGEIQNETTN